MFDFSLEAISESAKVLLMGLGIDVYLLLIICFFILFFICFFIWLKNNWSSMILSTILLAVILGVAYTIDPELVMHIIGLFKIAAQEAIAGFLPP